MSVALLNVADDALPGTAIADGGKSDFLTVRGTWTGDAISVESAALRDPPGRFPWPPSPCDPPPGGWPGWIPMDLDGETALRILSEQLAEEPAVFTEFWVAYLDPSRPTETDVAVVGTVGNVQGATERLSAIFPYNLCIIQVEYSAADLAAIEHRVGPMDPAWMPGIDWPSNRVEIELPFVVHASIARVGTDRDAVVFRPIVVKAGN